MITFSGMSDLLEETVDILLEDFFVSYILNSMVMYRVDSGKSNPKRQIGLRSTNTTWANCKIQFAWPTIFISHTGNKCQCKPAATELQHIDPG